MTALVFLCISVTEKEVWCVMSRETSYPASNIILPLWVYIMALSMLSVLVFFQALLSNSKLFK